MSVWLGGTIDPLRVGGTRYVLVAGGAPETDAPPLEAVVAVCGDAVALAAAVTVWWATVAR